MLPGVVAGFPRKTAVVRQFQLTAGQSVLTGVTLRGYQRNVYGSVSPANVNILTGAAGAGTEKGVLSYLYLADRATDTDYLDFAFYGDYTGGGLPASLKVGATTFATSNAEIQHGSITRLRWFGASAALIQNGQTYTIEVAFA